MKKMLIIASVSSVIEQFNMLNIDILQNLGYEVHVAASFNNETNISKKRELEFKKELKSLNITFFDLPINRNIFKIKNIQAYKIIKRLIQEQHYDLVHCHTPVVGVLARQAIKKLNQSKKNNIKVIYTAHGFHFYKGAPLKNWLLYYPVEKYLSKYTDCLITINEEDYQNTIARNFNSKDNQLVNGVGIDIDNFSLQTLEVKNQLRNEYNFTYDDCIIVNIGELNKNKNQIFLIQLMPELIKSVPNARLVLIGKGKLKEVYQNKIKELKLENHVDLLGYRKDIDNFLGLADIIVSASLREGLPVNLLESMAKGIPIVAINNRGSRQLIKDGRNGYIIEAEDDKTFLASLKKLNDSEKLRTEMGLNNRVDVQKYSTTIVREQLERIYKKYV